jgi:UDP:flavonoid glycosyltransferase YjiC (YdhE family)
MVMMPFGRDQVEIAARAAYARTGMRIRPGAGPSRIARAIREVLGDSAYREAAKRAARTIATELRGDDAADALEQLAGVSRVDGAPSGAGTAAPRATL